MTFGSQFESRDCSAVQSRGTKSGEHGNKNINVTIDITTKSVINLDVIFNITSNTYI